MWRTLFVKHALVNVEINFVAIVIKNLTKIILSFLVECLYEISLHIYTGFQTKGGFMKSRFLTNNTNPDKSQIINLLVAE